MNTNTRKHAKILFCGGGTAGHVTPNLALCDAIADLRRSDCNARRSPAECYIKANGTELQTALLDTAVDMLADAEMYYIGNTDMDERLVSPYVADGRILRYYRIAAFKLKRTFAPSNLLLPFRLWQSVREARRILNDVCPDVVFSKGGYVGLPVVIAAHKLGIPTVLHESDATIGLANKLCLRFTDTALSAFDTGNKHLKTVGMILRRGLEKGCRARGLNYTGYNGTKPLLLVVGGSLGAQSLNEAIATNDELCRSFDIFLLTGKGKKVNCDKIHQAEFANNMQDLFAAADVCLTRAGSTTLCELTMSGVPFVAVPLVKSSRGEQTHNACRFAEWGCGFVLNETDLTDKLTAVVNAAYDNRTTIAVKQKSAAKQLDGTLRVLNEIALVLKRKR